MTAWQQTRTKPIVCRTCLSPVTITVTDAGARLTCPNHGVLFTYYPPKPRPQPPGKTADPPPDSAGETEYNPHAPKTFTIVYEEETTA